MTLTIGSLFSGIGGLELGLEWAGLGPTVWQVEKDSFRRRWLARHWPAVERHADIRYVSAATLAPVDVICGGFPCRGVSSAGAKEGLVHRESALYREFVRIIGDIRPRYAIIEQPAVFVRRGLRDVLRRLAALGYDAEWSCLSACAVGAPHTRERVFVVAHTDACCQPTRPVHAEASGLRAYAERVRHWRQPVPDAVRVAHGVSRWLGAYGDAVVPQVAEVVGRRVIEIEQTLTRRAA